LPITVITLQCFKSRKRLTEGSEPSPESSTWGLYVCARGIDIVKIDKTPLIYSVSCFNLGVLEHCLGGVAHQSTLVATGLGRLHSPSKLLLQHAYQNSNCWKTVDS